MVSACVISIRAINRLVILSGFWTHQNKDGLHQWTPPPYTHPTAPISVMPIHSVLKSLLCLLCLNHEMKDLGRFSHESGYKDLTGAVSCPGYASFVDKHKTGIMVQFGRFVSWDDYMLLLQENLGNSKVCSVVKTTDFVINCFSIDTLVQHTSVEYSPLRVSEQNASLFTRAQLDPVFSVYQSGSIHNKCSEMQSLMCICCAFSRFA